MGRLSRGRKSVTEWRWFTRWRKRVSRRHDDVDASDARLSYFRAFVAEIQQTAERNARRFWTGEFVEPIDTDLLRVVGIDPETKEGSDV